MYGADLAYIHDRGHSGYVLEAAPGLLRLLRGARVRDGLVVDLGCGSGRWAKELNAHGYQVVGIDRSPAFIRMAREIAPDSRFVVRSLWKGELPGCDAMTAIGEVLNYAPDGRVDRLFARVYEALRPGGVFVFDAAGPSRMPGGTVRAWSEGRDWAVLVETGGDAKRGVLVRRIVSFRREKGGYRRSEEVHRLRLYAAAELVAGLEGAGFRVRTQDRYGRFRLPPGMTAFVCYRDIT